MRREVVHLNREMTNTSAQDEFAKWAKLRRQHDKLKEKYEERCTLRLFDWRIHTANMAQPKTELAIDRAEG